MLDGICIFETGIISDGWMNAWTDIWTRAPHAGVNARLQLHLENSTSKKGHNYVKKYMRITSPTGMGSPFDSEQLVSSKYLQ